MGRREREAEGSGDNGSHWVREVKTCNWFGVPLPHRDHQRWFHAGLPRPGCSYQQGPPQWTEGSLLFLSLTTFTCSSVCACFWKWDGWNLRLRYFGIGVPHYLLGTISPNVEFTAKDFRDSAIPVSSLSSIYSVYVCSSVCVSLTSHLKPFTHVNEKGVKLVFYEVFVTMKIMMHMLLWWLI